jgi:hypothetical protein
LGPEIDPLTDMIDFTYTLRIPVRVQPFPSSFPHRMSQTMTDNDTDRIVLSSDLVAEDRAVYNVHNSRSITAFRLSADARFLAFGDKSGRVMVRVPLMSSSSSGTLNFEQIRDLSRNGLRFMTFHAGDNVPIAFLLWHPSVTTEQRALFVASSNGFIHCVTFDVDTDNPVGNDSPVMTLSHV